METSNKLPKHELFNDLPDCEHLQSMLCESKWLGGLTESVGLNEFLARLMEKNKIHSLPEGINITLDYLHPLLKEGKLVVKITKRIGGEGNIYNKEEAQEAIEEIKKRWFEIWDSEKDEEKRKRKRQDYEVFNVQLRLPGGLFIH